MAPRVGPCHFMAARYETISPTLRAAVQFFWDGVGLGGGGGGGCCEPPPMGGGGFPGGNSVRRGRKNPPASRGPWAPSRTNLEFAGGDSAM